MQTVEVVSLTAAFVTAVVGTGSLEVFARRRGLYARVTRRGAHKAPIPRIGGPAIAAATLVAIALALREFGASTGVFIAGGTILLVIGVIDDIRSLPILPRFLGQVLVGGVTAYVLAPEFRIVLPAIDVGVGGWLAIVLVALWITAMVNVFNFMDGIDGIAAGSAVATMPAAMILGASMADAFAIGIAGACLGFLVWNHHPASIFMGDGGSQFLGYAVATTFLVDPGADLHAVPILLAVAPFLIDASATFSRRTAGRENVFDAHSNHLYQRLIRNGASQRVVVAGYIAAALVAGWTAVIYGDMPAWGQAVVIGMYVMAWVFVASNIPNVDRTEART